MNETVKKTVQKRSVETQNKIMNAAFTMYSRQGYYRTTVDEIAAEAGVSTGIAYRYFKNKKDLLLRTLVYLAENILSLAGMEGNTSDTPEAQDRKALLLYALEKFEQLHRDYYAFHEELEGLRHLDSDVKDFYDAFEKKAMQELADKLREQYGPQEMLKEKLQLAVSVMEQYCHTVTDIKYAELNREYLRDKTMEIVLHIFDGEIIPHP